LSRFGNTIGSGPVNRSGFHTRPYMFAGYTDRLFHEAAAKVPGSGRLRLRSVGVVVQTNALPESTDLRLPRATMRARWLRCRRSGPGGSDRVSQPSAIGMLRSAGKRAGLTPLRLSRETSKEASVSSFPVLSRHLYRSPQRTPDLLLALHEVWATRHGRHRHHRMGLLRAQVLRLRLTAAALRQRNLPPRS